MPKRCQCFGHDQACIPRYSTTSCPGRRRRTAWTIVFESTVLRNGKSFAMNSVWRIVLPCRPKVRSCFAAIEAPRDKRNFELEATAFFCCRLLVIQIGVQSRSFHVRPGKRWCHYVAAFSRHGLNVIWCKWNPSRRFVPGFQINHCSSFASVICTMNEQEHAQSLSWISSHRQL